MAPLYSPSLTVAQALLANESVSAVLISRKTACVGCYVARFCTLQEVANAYGLPLDDFLDELQRAAQSHPSVPRGAQNA